MVKRTFANGQRVDAAWFNAIQFDIAFDGNIDLEGHYEKIPNYWLSDEPGNIKSDFYNTRNALKVEEVSGLTVSVQPGNVTLPSGTLVSIGLTNLVLDDNVVNIIYIDDQGDLRKSSTAPQLGLLIARAETSGGSISGQIEDLRTNVNMLVQPLVDNAGSIIPTSSIMIYGGTVAPNGWLFCDGTPYDPSTYPELFSVIGYSFGQVGLSFLVPDMRDRSPVGAGISFGIGNSGGSATTNLSVDNMPAHSHQINDPGHTHSMNQGPGQQSAVALDYQNAANGVDAYVAQWGSHTHGIYASHTGISVGNTGNGTPVSIRNPYVACNYIIKV